MRSKSQPNWYTQDLLDWLLAEARFSENLDMLIARVGTKLVKAGAPLWRLRFSFRTLHPLVAAVSSVWERERVEIEHIEATHGMEHRPGYKGSPLEIVGRTGEPFRKQLEVDLDTDDHDVLHDLKARGATDYFVVPIQFREARRPMLVFVSDASDGFSSYDIDSLLDFASRIAPILEVFGLERKASAIAGAYLGETTGQRVLDGMITRGDVERIKAAVLVSDMRGWTSLNQQLPPEEALAIANSYFEVIADAVEAHQGEVLKFMGDGILAVFSAQGDEENACCRAARAARTAIESKPDSQNSTELKFGIGLHFGDVLYGNIGSKTRLDFTVMGEAVNIAARFESLCSSLEQPVLFTRALADRLDEPMRQLASERLKGYQEPFEVFTTT